MLLPEPDPRRLREQPRGLGRREGALELERERASVAREGRYPHGCHRHAELTAEEAAQSSGQRGLVVGLASLAAGADCGHAVEGHEMGEYRGLGQVLLVEECARLGGERLQPGPAAAGNRLQGRGHDATQPCRPRQRREHERERDRHTVR